MKMLSLFNNYKYEVIQGEDKEIQNLSISSNDIIKKTLYFCIKGLKVDGHKYIEEVVKKGASGIVVEDYQKEYIKGITFIKVDNVRRALSIAASNFYSNSWKGFRLVGVTGTNGKSSITYFMESILREYNKKVGLIGTIGNKVNNKSLDIKSATATTPESIELQKIFKRMKEEEIEAVVMEVSSHALQLEKLYGMNFEVGIFTNLTEDHLDFHNTLENYLKAKTKLFKMCNWGIINSDSDVAGSIIGNSNCKVITYGINNESDLKAINIEYKSTGVTFDIEYDNYLEHFEILIPGKFSVYNSLASIAGALAMDIPIEVIKKGLKNIKLIPGRMQKVNNNKGFLVIVDYAHTPDGLKNVISSVREFTKGAIITVFGCGGERDKIKRPLMGEIAGELSDQCIITSDNPRGESPEEIVCEIEKGILGTGCAYDIVMDREEAINLAINRVKKDDAVIIAGKGHESYQVLADKVIEFDDFEIAKKALEKLDR